MDRQVKITINGLEINADKNDTILKAARKNGVYIPTLCYLSKCEPISSCRLCVVEAENQEGLILACQTKVIDGLVVRTNSEKLAAERQKIMQLYCVNHPLECGVCDKSGECDLQNKTLEFGVVTQKFMAKEQKREIKDWGLIQYDPSLCILCEKCVHTCNEIIGDDAIEIKVGGYKSIIGPKNSDTLDCTFCGECIAVCPVGALISKEFKYSSNAWELKKVPSSCAHCSSACSLTYESKIESTESSSYKIYRVTNDFEFSTLCQAGRFGFDFDNKAEKCEKAFEKAVGALKSARTIKFNSYITNEEAKILQNIKEKLGVKLVNKDAYEFKRFMDAYSSVSGKSLYSANLGDLKNSDAIIVLGSMISTDNPMVRYALNEASKKRNAKVVYLHPIEDSLLAPNVNKFVKYEPKSEEGVIALLASIFADKNMLNDEQKAFFAQLDMGYVSSEASFDEAEQEEIAKMFARAKNKTLILGSDLYSHPRAENIARLAALFEKASDFKVLIIPSQTNTLGVSMICDLDERAEGFTVGYNEEGDFVLTSLGSEGRDNALDMPALNQQEGTFVNIDKRVVPLNAAIGFGGYELNDLANALGIRKELTVDYTRELPTSKGFKAISFDDLPNRFLNDGTEDRGYILETKEVEANGKIEEVASLEEMNGTLIYVSTPVMQFNAATAKCSQIQEDADVIYLGKAAAEINGVAQGDYVTVKVDNNSARYKVKLDDKISSNIVVAGAYTPNNPMFEALSIGYKFKRTEIIKG
jgi:NADH-quinone oxidoreductase subunit G